MKCLPVDIITSIQRRIAPQLLTDADYSTVEEILLQQYSVRQTYVASAVNFLHCKQKSDQSIEDYGRTLNALAAKCNYKQCCYDLLLKQVFIANLQSKHIMSTLLQKADGLSFNETLQKAKLLQQIKDDTEVIQKYDRSVNTLQTAKSPTVSETYTCYRCGAVAKHHINDCFAKNLTCNHCKKTGHIKNVCKQLQKKFSKPAVSPVQHHQKGFSSAQPLGINRARHSGAPPIRELQTAHQATPLNLQQECAGTYATTSCGQPSVQALNSVSTTEQSTAITRAPSTFGCTCGRQRDDHIHTPPPLHSAALQAPPAELSVPSTAAHPSTADARGFTAVSHPSTADEQLQEDGNISGIDSNICNSFLL